MRNDLRNPWFVAVWPGMGGVAQIAGTYLVRQLGATQADEFDARAYFEPGSISVKEGLVRPTTPTRSLLFGWRNPAGPRDLLIFVGEEQPTGPGYRYAQALADFAADRGVERVVTFAAMATPSHPSAEARVFGVATRRDILDELLRHDAVALDEGEIAGMNGLFVAAAAARGIPAFCLLGEFPFFAAQFPNPKASAAVLDVFARTFGMKLDLGPIRADAARIEERLVGQLEALERAAREAAGKSGEDSSEESDAGDASAAETEAEKKESAPPSPAAPFPPKEKAIPGDVLDKIEKLFTQAKKDRGKALELKAELDRRGLFKRFEDRFLDLFKQAG